MYRQDNLESHLRYKVSVMCLIIHNRNLLYGFYYVVSSYNLPGGALSNHIDTSQISYVAASVSYDSSNGVLTVTPAALYFYTNWDGGEMSARRQTTISTYVYLIK